MRAVNLIPTDERRTGSVGKSGGAVYILLGVLTVFVVFSGLWTITSKQVKDSKAQVAQLEVEAGQAEQRSQKLTPYKEFNQMAKDRVATVRGLAAGRFDWAFAMHEVSRVLPRDVSLTGLVATTAPGVSVEGAGANTGMRASVAAPAIEINGCTPSHDRVALLLTRLRRIDGVQRVSLGSSEKLEVQKDQASGGGGGSGGDDCRQGSDRVPQFTAVIFFRPVQGLTAPATGGAATAPSTTPAAPGQQTPSTPAAPSTSSAPTATATPPAAR